MTDTQAEILKAAREMAAREVNTLARRVAEVLGERERQWLAELHERVGYAPAGVGYGR